jgi:DNA-binding transcriptional MerR regulator
MISIGDFSRLARVSCRLLRYYDEIGLLEPANVDSFSGYRYYSATQLPRLNRILVLKDLGFSLEEIAKLVDENVSAAALRGMLSMRRSEVERTLAAEAERLRSIEMRIAQVDAEGQLAAEDVIIRQEPARCFLAIRQTVPSFLAARSLLRAVAETVPQQVAGGTLGSLMAVAYAPEFEVDSIDVQVGFLLERSTKRCVSLPGHGLMTLHELPAVERMATCVRIGLPEHAHLVTARIARAIEANGQRLAGPSREVFLETPRFDRMQDSVVEMQYPITQLSAR